MPDTTNFWDAFSPYMDLLENALGINLDNLGPVIPLIKSRVLVVGAGQGLLVEELRKRGFTTEGIDLSPQMVAFAEKRRGIKLFLANANNMPFEKGQFKTSIIATGVIDFLNETRQIEAILNEVRRVTDAQGEVLVAFFGITPQTEELAKYIGVLSDTRANVKVFGRMVLGAQNPRKEILALIRMDPDKSIPGLILRAYRAFMSMRKRARTRIKSARALKKSIESGEIQGPGILLNNLPEYMFIRSETQIRELFAGLNLSPRKIYVFDNCKIVRL
jgi:ubiquinone/menaquinone biosynthesis C-methylase UbiE